MSEPKENWQRIYALLNAENKPKFLCLPYTKQRQFFFFFTELELFNEKWEGRIEQKAKKKAF